MADPELHSALTVEAFSLGESSPSTAGDSSAELTSGAQYCPRHQNSNKFPVSYYILSPISSALVPRMPPASLKNEVPLQPLLISQGTCGAWT